MNAKNKQWIKNVEEFIKSACLAVVEVRRPSLEEAPISNKVKSLLN